MPQPEYKILDAETVKDPEVLVELIHDLMMANKALSRVCAINSVLILHHLGEFVDPPVEDYKGTVAVLKDFLALIHEDALHEEVANAVRDLLNAKE